MKNATTVRTSDRTDRRKPSSSDLAQDRLTIQHRPVRTLRLDPRNPREHSKKQIAQIAESILAFGFNVPVLIDDENKIIAGHGRVLACQLLGIAEVPTICLGHLPPEQVRAFIIADNKLTENATWNEILLGQQLRSLSEIDLNFSLEATGFEMGEIDVLIEGLSQPRDSAQSDPADVLPDQSEIPVTAPGDWWQLRKHRVLCGDALEAGSYDQLMTQQRAAVVFTDPPCNLPTGGRASRLGEKQQCDFATAGSKVSPASYSDFLGMVCKRLVSASRDGATHFLCIDWRHVGVLLAAGMETYDELKNICVWVKDDAGTGSPYRSQHQLILVFTQGKQSRRNSAQLGQFGRRRSNVWQYPGANSISRGTAEGSLLDLHPTGMPVALVADAIQDCSSRGDIVLDPFLGSGTTVIAAERTGRICYGIEIDPAHVDTAVRRWQRLTSMCAVHGESGRSFDDLERKATNARER
jgi:DNA modification methylase